MDTIECRILDKDGPRHTNLPSVGRAREIIAFLVATRSDGAPFRVQERIVTEWHDVDEN